MNWLRNAYRFKVRTTSLVEPVEAVHFQVPNDTPMFEKPNVFGSRVWMKVPENDGFGEQSAGRVCCGKLEVDWYNGSQPTKFAGGLDPCGTDEVAKSGGGPADPIFATLPDGSAPCCFGGPVWADVFIQSQGILSFFQGRGDTMLPSDVIVLTDLFTDPPTEYFRVNNPPYNTFEYFQEGAFECEVVFEGPPLAYNVRLVFHAVSSTTVQLIWWGNGTAKIRQRFNASGFTRDFIVVWMHPPPP